MKRSRESSARDERAEKREKSTQRIDFSDIPELSDQQFSRMRRVGRPAIADEPRKMIAIRLDPKVLAWARRTAEQKGLPYQSFINEVLAREMQKAARK